MPEICEVALTAQYLMTKLRGRYMTHMRVIAGKYTHTSLPGKALIEKYQPLRIMKVDSKGKFMWFELESHKKDCRQKIYILNNFGLTGEWSFGDSNSDRVLFDIETGQKKYVLHYADARNFGLLQVTDDEDVLNERINKLAPDVLKTQFDSNDFANWVASYLAVSSRRKDVPIVSALLHQNKSDGIVSGIGNYLSAEILYRAKISPYTPVGKLTGAQIVALVDSAKYLVKLCYVSNNTPYVGGLGDFLDKHQEGVVSGKYPNYHPDVDIPEDEVMEFKVYGRKTDDAGNTVRADNISTTRNTYWVPKVQKSTNNGRN